jgi:hypothetical protein
MLPALQRIQKAAPRDILRNPKYTGYMVWNRRATKKGGKVNPPEAWVWSEQPTHELHGISRQLGSRVPLAGAEYGLIER